jgi:hypothetical protein
VELEVDEIIRSLLEVRTTKPGKLVALKEADILGLIRVVKTIFLEQPMLLEVTAPLKICGDIHGQYYDMLRLFEYGGLPPESNYLFLGDYVDRGRQGIETICLLFALKIKHPNKVHILRGNHESASITRIYGFYEECTLSPTQARTATRSSSGRPSSTASTACPSQRSSRRRSCACTADYRPSSFPSIRSTPSRDPPTSPTPDCSATCCGQTHSHRSRCGGSRSVELATCSGRR